MAPRRNAVLCAGIAALVAFPALPMPAAAQPASPEERAAAVARPALVLVKVNWHGWVRDRRSGEVFGGSAGYDVTVSCTGVVINPSGYVATASHCVHTGLAGGTGALYDAAIADLAQLGRIGDRAKAKQALAEHAVAEGPTPDSLVDRAIQVERMAGESKRDRDIAPATVVDLVAPTDGDVAVLKIPRDRLPAMEPRPDAPPVGTPILAIGYPGTTDVPVDENLEPSSKNGQISAHRTQQRRPFYEFSAAATHGMSGGPLVDMQGRVVGLISQGSPTGTQSFNLASAASTLADILRSKDIDTALGTADRNYRTGLDRFFAGDLDAAVEYFDAVLADLPTHQQAATYRRLAIDQGGSAGAGTTLLLVLAICSAGVALAAGAAGAAVTVAGRRRHTVSTMDTPPFGFPIPPVQPATPPPAEPPPAKPPEAPTEKLTARPLREGPTENLTARPPSKDATNPPPAEDPTAKLDDHRNPDTVP